VWLHVYIGDPEGGLLPAILFLPETKLIEKRLDKFIIKLGSMYMVATG
jgi:hypothetical protein